MCNLMLFSKISTQFGFASEPHLDSSTTVEPDVFSLKYSKTDRPKNSTQNSICAGSGIPAATSGQCCCCGSMLRMPRQPHNTGSHSSSSSIKTRTESCKQEPNILCSSKNMIFAAAVLPLCGSMCGWQLFLFGYTSGVDFAAAPALSVARPVVVKAWLSIGSDDDESSIPEILEFFIKILTKIFQAVEHHCNRWWPSSGQGQGFGWTVAYHFGWLSLSIRLPGSGVVAVAWGLHTYTWRKGAGPTAECHYEIELNFRTTSTAGGRHGRVTNSKVDKEGLRDVCCAIVATTKNGSKFMNTWE